MRIFSKKNMGMSLVEVIIASAIVLLLSTILVSANIIYFRTARTNLKEIKAIYLLEEGIEAVNFIKNNDWNNLGSVGTDYYLAWNGTSWTATTTKILIDQTYERKFYTTAVNRNTDGDIADSGSLDSDTKKLTVQVSWPDVSGTTTKSLSAYLFKPND